MEVFDYVVIATNPLLSLSLYKIFNTLYSEVIYNKTVEKISYFLYCVIISIVSILTSLPIVFFIVNIILFFMISLNYEGKVLMKIINVFWIYAILTIIETIIVSFTGLLSINPFEQSNYNSIVGILLIRIILLVFSYIIYGNKNNFKKDIDLPQKYYVSIILVLVGTLYLFIRTLQTPNLKVVDVLISAMIVLTINIVIILLFENLYKSFSVKIERDILWEQTRAYENQNEIINRVTSSLKSIKHDMSNHLSVLGELSRNDKIDELQNYIYSMSLKTEVSDRVLNSDNFIFDSIINFKLMELKDEDVEISLNVVVPSNIEILAYDLTVILGNLLDNAIRALKTPHENKKLQIQARCSKGSLLIYVDNTFSEDIIRQHGKIITSKDDKENHGLGLKNIEKSLENYNGFIKISHTEKIFSASVLIPYGN